MTVSANSTDISIQDARMAQLRWAQTSLAERLEFVRKFRQLLVERSDTLLDSVSYPSRNGPAETLAAELIPLADACRFLEKEAPKLLRPRTARRSARPLWLSGVSLQQRLDPWGIVLIVGASNYPLFLTGVQAMQALAAGNGVWIKPGVGAGKATRQLRETMLIAGLDPALCTTLPECPSWVKRTIDAGVDHVVLTGSVAAGTAVNAMAAETMTPVTMELSGCDAVFVLANANIERVAKALAFGLRFNRSATCIAPRRVFVPKKHQTELEQQLMGWIATIPPSATSWSAHARRVLVDAANHGAEFLGGLSLESALERQRPLVIRNASAAWSVSQESLFEPIISLIPVSSPEEALELDQECPYALGATVFGPNADAKQLAKRIHAGCVVINDMIAPTADPRIAFGGRGQSGFGVTRGAAGLQAMTQLKTIVHQRSRFLPHLDVPSPHDAQLLSGFFAFSHAETWKTRLAGIWSAMRAGLAQHQWKQEHSSNESMESKSCRTTNGSQSSAAA